MKDKLKSQISQLTKALARLKEALDFPKTAMNKDASIQRFEFSFELCWKLMQGIAQEKGLVEILTPRDSIRTAAQLKLINNVELWFDFLKDRNLSSHLYDEGVSLNIYEDIKKFLPEAEEFLTKIKSESLTN